MTTSAIKSQVKAVMKYYDKLARTEVWLKWVSSEVEMTLKEANAYFVGVMLNKQQSEERAWEGGKHMVENHFKGGNFWQNIANTDEPTAHKICTTGYNERSYALMFSVNKFPKRLHNNAQKMLDKYGGDPRKIWTVKPQNARLIYNRFRSFEGIGDALAKMAQFILVRNYGMAGGEESKHLMSVKPDTHLCRVVSRIGITDGDTPLEVEIEVDDLELESPADFDAAALSIGREFCRPQNPNCGDCPVASVCDYNHK